MHDAAYEYVQRWATDAPIRVIELGSRHTWGQRLRPLFPNAGYVGVDAVEGPDVDVVANAAEYVPAIKADLVICAEVFEHTPRWREIVASAFAALWPGGRAVFTCAGPGRAVHGVNHDDPDQPGYYANVELADLFRAMVDAGFTEIYVDGLGEDARATGVRPWTP